MTTMENGVVKVVRGSMVAMKRTCHGNIDHLLGTIIIGNVSRKMDKSSKDPMDCTRIWHMPLGIC